MNKTIFDNKYEEDFLCPQGSTYGVKVNGFFSAAPNKQALKRKGDFCQRGTPHYYRHVDNSKKRGRKSLTRQQRNFSFRYI